MNLVCAKDSGSFKRDKETWDMVCEACGHRIRGVDWHRLSVAVEEGGGMFYGKSAASEIQEPPEAKRRRLVDTMECFGARPA